MININAWFFTIPLHPLIPLTLLFIIGITAQYYVDAFFLFFFIWIVYACITSFFEIKKHLLILASGASFLAGAAFYQKKINSYDHWFSSVKNQKVSLVVFIENYEKKDTGHLKYTYNGTIEKMVQQETEYAISNKKILLYSPVKLPIARGQWYTIDNITVKKPTSASFFNYCLKESIASVLVVTHHNKICNTQQPWFSIKKWIIEKRAELYEQLKSKLTAPTFSLFSLLFLGNKALHQKQLTQLKNWFKQWGISHYLARSGLHLVMILIAWELLLKCIPIPFILKQSFLLLFSIVYMLLSWSSLSFLRSLFLLCIHKISIIWYKQTHSLYTISLATLFFLAINPIQLFFLDFQLSFGITALLAWYYHLESHKKLNY